LSTTRPAAPSSSHSAAAPREIAGVLPVFQTPFNEDERIDPATLDKEITWLFDAGADGIVMAMVSEVLRLSSEERDELATLACRYGRHRGVVIISVGAESSKIAERYAKHAQDVGADAVMAVPPITVALGETELIAYYKRIIDAIKIPVVVQDASGYVGQSLPVKTLARLHDEFGERVLFKPEAVPIGPRLTALLEATGNKARVLEGTGGLMLVDSFRRGIVGTMPGADLIHGLVALWRALKSGDDDDRVYRLAGPISAICNLENSLDAFLVIEKHLLVKQGIFRNAICRKPSGYVLDDWTRKEVDRLFDLLNRAIGK
jgi:dihydrodipicolinate synthase/N-acetylneuraminate lyase